MTTVVYRKFAERLKIATDVERAADQLNAAIRTAMEAGMVVTVRADSKPEYGSRDPWPVVEVETLVKLPEKED